MKIFVGFLTNLTRRYDYLSSESVTRESAYSQRRLDSQIIRWKPICHLSLRIPLTITRSINIACKMEHQPFLDQEADDQKPSTPRSRTWWKKYGTSSRGNFSAWEQKSEIVWIECTCSPFIFSQLQPLFIYWRGPCNRRLSPSLSVPGLASKSPGNRFKWEWGYVDYPAAFNIHAISVILFFQSTCHLVNSYMIGSERVP